MGYRAIYSYCALTVGWLLLAMLSFLSHNIHYHSPFSSLLVIVTSGLIVGIIYGSAVTLKQLQLLERNGETRITFTVWLFIIGAVFIIIAATFLFVEYLPFSWANNLQNFLFALVPASLAARTLLFLGWELRHKRKIMFADLVSSKLYVFPKVEVAPIQNSEATATTIY